MINRHVTRVVCTAAAIAGLLVTGLAGPASAASTGNGTSAGNAAGYRTFSGRLYGVAATSATNVWAVGLHPNSSLIVHWNGTTWTQSLATRIGYFNGVATEGRTDAWAVGMTNPSTCSPQCRTMILHWNGTAWSRVPSPNPAARYLNTLLGVVVIRPHSAWAVGSTDFDNTLITHWNGKTWS